MALSGCGGSTSTAPTGSEPQTIKFSFSTANPTDTFLQDTAAAFEKANPGTKIELVKLPAETEPQTVTTQLQGGNAADVMNIHSGQGQVGSMAGFAKAGLLLELNDTEFSEQLPQSIKNLFTYQDKVYAVPLSSMPTGLIFNQAKAQELGVTLNAGSTFDDFLGQCKVARDKGVSLTAIAGTVPGNPGIMTMTLAASTVYGPNPNWNADRAGGKTTFSDTKGWQQALEGVKQMFDAGCFQDGAAGAGFDTLIGSMGQGKALGFFAPGGAAKSIADGSKGAVNPVVLPMPAPGVSDEYLGTTAELALAGNAKTKSPTLVKKFLKFFSEKEGAETVAKGQGTLPVNLGNYPLPATYEPIADLYKADKVRPLGQTDWPNAKVYDSLGKGVTAIITGQKSAADVLKDMDTAWGK
ncbi:ABC transporter substrate-binding protein [Pseudarthrobacter sp. BRE9]|uniref:ABC transporter substrate-binding protein n=1 Tax=Pseudarthrobacter sp. BRE9 TaxID=2962582 RepID=UPI002882122D|nr:ABC transporter substrate-binding protein [Pseudarthrobacter sp. BRE9]MDT0169199.1 ABC transporter substrate-binding protein [Pseudarthrobacter sp. BRE9]